MPGLDLVQEMEKAFAEYSRGKAVIPPVGEMKFEDPPGDVHIKYGHLKSGKSYVVKIASGFYENPQWGLPSSQGLMLLFNQQTGQLRAVLLDEGKLTDARTGAAGAAAAKHLSKKKLKCVGIVGAGIQAREQARYLLKTTECREMIIWARDEFKALTMADDAQAMGWKAGIAADPETLARSSDLIITVTPAESPILRREWIQPGTCIVAVGSDTAEKQELEAEILKDAELVVADSLSQSESRGEIHRAVSAGKLDRSRLVELGQVISGQHPGRTSKDQIAVVDLTGVAVQDLAIASAVERALRT